MALPELWPGWPLAGAITRTCLACGVRWSLPQLMAIRTANPGQPPSIYANALMAQHRIPTDGRTVKAALNAWDEHQPAAST